MKVWLAVELKEEVMTQRAMLLTPAGMVKKFKEDSSSDVEAQWRRRILGFQQKPVRNRTWNDRDKPCVTQQMKTANMKTTSSYLSYQSVYLCVLKKQKVSLSKYCTS